MKRYFILLALVLFAINSYSTPVTIYPGLTLEENSGTYYVHFEMPKYEIVTDTFTVTHPTPLPTNQLGHAQGDYYFSRVEPVEDDYFDYLSVDGRPELPFYSLNLLMPLDGGDYMVGNINIISADTIKLPYPYTPSQAENYTFEDFSFDASYYVSYNNTWYWDECAADTIWYRNSKGFTFSVFPCHYEPSGQELVVVTEAEYEIIHNGSYLTGSYLEYMLSLDRSFYFFYDNFVGFTEPYPLINKDEYLIITEDAWNNTTALADFIQHKESLGYHVTKTPLHDIGYTSEYIRKYIKEEYETNNTKFVLLVGNVGNPDSLAFSDGFNADYHNPPTDIYYSCLSKDDINDQWKDYSPTVFVGRWPVQNTTQLRNVVDKTIASDLYLYPALINHGSSKITLFSGDGSNTYTRNYFYNDCKYIYNHIIQNYSYYTGTVFDGRSSSTNFYTMKNAMEIMDDPTWIFVYRGHGDSDDIGHPYDWYDCDINNIVTSTLPFQPLGFGFTCLTGNIYEHKNFAREWLMSTEGGITFLGSTTISYSECNRYFSRKMFNQLEDRPNMTIGEFVGNAKAKYYNPDKVVWRRREAKKYVLYGDPSLYLFGLDIQYNQPYNSQEHSRRDDEEFTDDIISVNIYSMTGQLLRTCDDAKPNLQGLPAGTYMVVYNSNNNSITQKLVLQ